MLPTHLMMCHGAELAPKAFLLTPGRTLTEFAKPPLNHDLKLLLKMATAAGLKGGPTTTGTPRSLADAATNFYSDMAPRTLGRSSWRLRFMSRRLKTLCGPSRASAKPFSPSFAGDRVGVAQAEQPLRHLLLEGDVTLGAAGDHQNIL